MANKDKDKEIFAEILDEMIERYNTYREKWIRQYGSPNGFDHWFTEQALKTIERGDT